MTKRGTHAARQQFLDAPPFPPIIPSFGWFRPLSEPVRTRRMPPSRQQFLAAPPMEIGGSSGSTGGSSGSAFNGPTSAEIGIAIPRNMRVGIGIVVSS